MTALTLLLKDNVLRLLCRSLLPKIGVNRNFLQVMVLVLPAVRGLGLINIKVRTRIREISLITAL